MRTDDMPLPAILMDTMRQRGWNVRALAEAAGVNAPTLYDNLRGDTQMSLRTALRLAGALKLKSREEDWQLLTQLQELFETPPKDRLIQVLTKVVSTMDVPPHRKDMTKRANVRWLETNIQGRNQRHPRLKTALRLIEELLK